MTDGNGGFVVRIPQRRQMTKNVAMFGQARFESPEEADELLAQPLADGKIQVEWSYLRFAEHSMPVPTTVPGVVRYGQHQRDPDAIVSWKTKHPGQTWIPVRKGRRPTVFATRQEAQDTAQEHLDVASHFAQHKAGTPPGNLRHFQVVGVDEYKRSLRSDVAHAVTEAERRAELLVAQREAETAAAKVAAPRGSEPVQPPAQEDVPDDPDEKRKAILEALATGESQADTAKRFGLSEKTVYRYKKAATRTPDDDDAVGALDRLMDRVRKKL